MKKNLALIILLFCSLQLAAQEQVMYAHFIDMGQGLATLIQFPKGVIMIDAGRQMKQGGPASKKKVLDYLTNFFTKNPQYNWTIDAIIITHNHVDHTSSIPAIYSDKKIKIKSIVTSLQNITDDVKIPLSDGVVKHEYIDYTAIIPKIPNGLTDVIIDPEKGYNGINPEIKVFSGRIDKWKDDEHLGNSNWHSIATRIKFGNASFLFTGDMQEESIQFMLDTYKSHTNVFNVDVYQVGHHGSDNATTQALLDAMTPKYAIISASHKDDKTSGSGYDYGHPSVDVIALLQKQIIETRPTKVKGFGYKHIKDHGHTFTETDITKNVFCTCWDGNVVVKATSNGVYTIQ